MVMRDSHGFTLIELLTTMVIIGLLLMLTVPNFSDYLNEKNLESTAIQIAGDIRHIQQMASATENSSYQIVFYREQGYYQVLLGLKVVSRKLMPGGVEIDDVHFNNAPLKAHILRIDAKGIPYPIGGHVLLASGDKKKYVIVASITGRVRVSDKLE